MSKTKPPEGYETWIEAAIAFIDPTEMICTGREDDPVVVGGDAKDMATSELQQLRAKAAAYQEAMAALRIQQPNCAGALPRSHAECDLCRFFKREIAAGRFAP